MDEKQTNNITGIGVYIDVQKQKQKNSTKIHFSLVLLNDDVVNVVDSKSDFSPKVQYGWRMTTTQYTY